MRAGIFFVVAFVVAPSVLFLRSQAQDKLPKRPVELDKGVVWQRDPATGELRITAGVAGAAGASTGAAAGANAIRVRTQIVPVTCVVSTADGTAVPGLRREDFRVFEDGLAQRISYFDASTQPASVALILDASPSVLPDADEMHAAAGALIDALAPLDQAAVINFSAHTYLQLPFSDAREEIRRAVDRVNVRELFTDTGGSNIYQAVYLAAEKLFRGRTGRKAIVLLTDGQDSGLGLTYDPASMSPDPDRPNALAFDDVARLLAAEDIQLFAVSTENRPKVMTPAWIEAHQDATLATLEARRQGIPAYTLYLAELVRRAGGQLYFLNESASVADTFRKIAEKIRSEYTLGFYPEEGAGTADDRTGWHPLRVEAPGEPGIRIGYRAAYYVPIAAR
ncbi:MAG TPA: VWA domain-containing protein [Candidatus Aquilonibacter sp.]|nr:VWA domain-containing protein [Candidatus Aquilonibacter sp.]